MAGVRSRERTADVQRNLVALCAVLVIHVVALAQVSAPVDDTGALFGPEPVVNAPFTADAVTMTVEIVATGARVAHYGTTRYYRDAAGRVRVEQKVPDAPPGRGTYVKIAPHPDFGWDRQMTSPVASVFNTTREFAIPVGYLKWRSFPLRERDGHVVVGIDEGKWVEGVYQKTISPELKLLVGARFSDAHGVLFDYNVTIISRAEPRPELFVREDGPVTINGAEPASCFVFGWTRPRCLQ